MLLSPHSPGPQFCLIVANGRKDFTGSVRCPKDMILAVSGHLPQSKRNALMSSHKAKND